MRVRVTLWALGAVAVAHAILVVSGLANASAAWVRVTDVLYVVASVLCAVVVWWRARDGDERVVWSCLSVALALMAAGNLTWDVLYLNDPAPPYPSVSDGFWIAFYLPCYAALASLTRTRLRGVPRAVTLDGLIGGLGLAALVAGVVLPPVIASTHGSTAAVITNLTYPVGDLMMLTICAAAAGMNRLRPGLAWLLLVGGLSAYAVADGVYVTLAANGTYVDGGPLDILWVLGGAMIALAAWTPEEGASRPVGTIRATHTVPAVFSGVALTLLVYGAGMSDLATAAVVLATATLAVAALRVSGVVREVQALSESRRLAESDDLTGLLNRRGLMLRLEAALAHTRETGTPLSLLLLDLDRFKEVNDALGHAAGDRLLAKAAARLQDALPEATLARLGGDEFVAVMRCSATETERRAHQVRAHLARPVDIEGVVTHTQASIGIATFPEDGGRRSDLLRCADVAMYRAKQHPTGVQRYTADGDRNTRERLNLVADLRDAITNREQIKLVFQPQVDLLTGRARTVEALVRWQHPVHGLLTPDRFLEIAEQHALMHALTLAVLDQTLQQQRAWRRVGVDLNVAVNVSAADLLNADFPNEIAALLRDYDTTPGTLVLELTESTVMREPGRVLDTLARLSELGMALSLDDFGTGYSSLAHLKRLPVQELKIDRSFVLDMLHDHDSAVIVATIIELARSLELRVVAEGVETVEHAERLRGLRCGVAQGFLFTRPLPPAQVLSWLTNSGEKRSHSKKL